MMAAVVILQSYLPLLFDRLRILEEGGGLAEETKRLAVHYLQYLVSGRSESEEHHLPLNKLLCGLHPSSPVERRIDLEESTREQCLGLIRAVIDHWPAIGASSIDGVRGNWLVRPGVLAEEEERWSLVVESRSYDVLLQRSPFSFSVIKFQWMEKPLHVTWPY